MVSATGGLGWGRPPRAGVLDWHLEGQVSWLSKQDGREEQAEEQHEPRQGGVESSPEGLTLRLQAASLDHVTASNFIRLLPATSAYCGSLLPFISYL